MPVRELSDRLTKVGRPILPSGITKIEQGSRRVDADDLAALALVLDVTPNRLLLTEGTSGSRIVLSPDFFTLSARSAWAWACGDELIVHGAAGDDETDTRWSTIRPRYERFVHVNRPHDPKDLTSIEDLLPHKAKLTRLAAMVEELESEGVPRKAAYHYVEMRLREDNDDG